MYVKKKSKRWLIVLSLLIVFIVAGTAIFYAVLSAPFPVKAGVKVGDTFVYDIICHTMVGQNATITSDVYDYNKTDYFQVDITGVNGSIITLGTSWKFDNGTIRMANQTLDLATGARTSSTGWWLIFSSGLSIGDRLRPISDQEWTVNATETWNYTGSSRPTNYFEMYSFPRDPRTNMTWDDEDFVFFDTQTGVATTITHAEIYLYPEAEVLTTYRLVRTNAWTM
jgi:hypothetical protein